MSLRVGATRSGSRIWRARVKAVFEEERHGSMLDVRHFTLLDR